MNSFLVHLYRLSLNHERDTKPQTFPTSLCNLIIKQLILQICNVKKEKKEKKGQRKNKTRK